MNRSRKNTALKLRKMRNIFGEEAWPLIIKWSRSLLALNVEGTSSGESLMVVMDGALP